MIYDLAMAGAGAKGLAFVGAYAEMVERGHTAGRLLGISGGAVIAALIAAGYSPTEMLELLEERTDGRSVFSQFLSEPPPFTANEIRASYFRAAMRDTNLPFIPDFLHKSTNDAAVDAFASSPLFRHAFAFLERGGWFSADGFVGWLTAKLDTGQFQDKPRQFSAMTLAEFFAATQVELTLVASDTTDGRMLVLNHNTAADCPLIWAVRMSISIPLIWDEVVWATSWGRYRERDLADHAIADGGLQPSCPIELLISNEPLVTQFMGLKQENPVLALLADESLPVPQPASAPELPRDVVANQGYLRALQRMRRMTDVVTATGDKSVMDEFSHLVARLPAGGYGATEFDMSHERRTALVQAGRDAMGIYFTHHVDVETIRSKLQASKLSARISHSSKPSMQADRSSMPSAPPDRIIQDAANRKVAEETLQNLDLPQDIMNMLRQPVEALGLRLERNTVRDRRELPQPKAYTYTAIRNRQFERIIVHITPELLESENLVRVYDPVTLLGDAFRGKAETVYVCSMNQQSIPAGIEQLFTNYWADHYQIVGRFIPWASLTKLEAQTLEQQKYELSKGPLRLGELLASGPEPSPLLILSNSQLIELRNALKKAFPTARKLKVKLTYRLGEGAARINEGSDIEDAVFELIGWAESTGNIETLIRAAYAENSESPELRTFAKQILPKVIE